MSDDKSTEIEIMKWCAPHWDELRRAIDAHGLGRLVSRGGEAAAMQMADEMRFGNRRDREGFDPLLRAWSMISTRALEMGSGLIGCPLCYVQTHHDTCTKPECHKPTPTEWINGCVAATRTYAQELGLIPKS